MNSDDFWTFVDMSGGPDACWPWNAGKNGDGYGNVRIGSVGKLRAHRVAYEFSNGPIPTGQIVCHTCDNPPCCNPRHLWLGDHALNAKDREAKGRGADARKTHCPQGHPYDEVNTYVAPNGARHCRECRREQQRNDEKRKIRNREYQKRRYYAAAPQDGSPS